MNAERWQGSDGARSEGRDERPRVVFLADRPNWAFHFVARALMARLSHRFRFRLIHRETEPLDIRAEDIDLLYVFWWGDRSYAHLDLPPQRIVKEVASHRWALEERFGRLSARDFASQYLSDCAWVTTPSKRLFEMLQPLRPGVLHCPNGVELSRFRPRRRHRGPLQIGWVGSPSDSTKGLQEILLPATEGTFHFEHSDGRRTPREIEKLYNRVDVIAIASQAESQPLPLLEAMACGCFPVATDVGIVPEVIRPPLNGLVVERNPDAFREAFAWCRTHLQDVRRAGAFNARLMAEERSWDLVADRFGDLFDAALGRGPEIPAAAPSPDGAARAALTRGAVSVRAAFVTPEFVTEDPSGGGLGNYVGRMARALVDAGHEVEIFVPSRHAPARLDHRGITVRRVSRAVDRLVVRGAMRACRHLGLSRLAQPLSYAIDALNLARALRRREAELPFDFVQSADHLAVGLFIDAWGRRRNRPHLVRCSNDGGWLAEINLGGEHARGWLSGLERRCIRAADVAYAPSHFLAQHYALHHDIRLSVVRPPAFREVEPRAEISFELPKRYFLHFGQLTPAKGTAVLAAALPLVWEREPDFSMVWAGRDCVFQFGEWSRSWGRHRDKVHWLQPLARPELYAVLAGADAAVLPSRFDNLPNTVIESLLHGVPVIGTRATSTDELVEPGVNGLIVPANDAAALADAIVRQWRGETGVRKGFRWDGPLVESMRPERAVEALLALAGFGKP